MKNTRRGCIPPKQGYGKVEEMSLVRLSGGMSHKKELEIEMHQEMTTETNVQSVERNSGGK